MAQSDKLAVSDNPEKAAETESAGSGAVGDAVRGSEALRGGDESDAAALENKAADGGALLPPPLPPEALEPEEPGEAGETREARETRESREPRESRESRNSSGSSGSSGSSNSSDSSDSSNSSNSSGSSNSSDSSGSSNSSDSSDSSGSSNSSNSSDSSNSSNSRNPSNSGAQGATGAQSGPDQGAPGAPGAPVGGKRPSYGAFAAIGLLIALMWGFWATDSGEKRIEIQYAPDFLALVEGGFVHRVEIVSGEGLSRVKGKVEHPADFPLEGAGDKAPSAGGDVPKIGRDAPEIAGANVPEIAGANVPGIGVKARGAGGDSATAAAAGEHPDESRSIEAVLESMQRDAPPSREALLASLAEKYPDGTLFETNARVSDSLERVLIARGVSYSWTQQDNRIVYILAQILPTLLFVGLIYFLFYRNVTGKNGLGFGKSRARISAPDPANRITFKDVAGCDEAKEEVVEVVEYLTNPANFGRLGGKMPRGIMLSGPPGTGKTLLAKAIAGEADVPFFSISGSDFVEMFVGVGASRVRDMFVQAKKHAPCLVFIDEIDAVGRRRGAGIGGGHDEREQTLNALLVEMDGFATNNGIVVIAATNRPDVLDPALLRPGRFDRQLVVDLPTMEGRLAILKVHAKKVKLAPGTDLSKIARGTPGCSGADLANIVNEAALVAARAEKPGVDEDDFEAARDKVLWGKERRSHAMDEEEKRLTAYHEAGHAICAVLEKHADPVHKVTIIPRGMALGLTAFLPKKDRTHYKRSEILADLVVAMGGRAAEETFLDDVSTGARQDIRQATQLAHSYVCDWGLSPTLGPRSYGKNEELVFLGAEVNRTQDYSEGTAEKIDAEVDRLVREAHETALAHLRDNRAAVESLVSLLLEKETVDGEEVARLAGLSKTL